MASRWGLVALILGACGSGGTAGDDVAATIDAASSITDGARAPDAAARPDAAPGPDAPGAIDAAPIDAAPNLCGNGAIDQGEECDPPSVANGCTTSCQGARAWYTGNPCTFDGQCIGGVCLTPAEGFPNGYCSHVGCDLSDPFSCDAFAYPDGISDACLDVSSDPNNPFGLCFAHCDMGACPPSYTCTDVGAFSNVCLPP